jgi:WD40 repeat protein
MTIGSSLPSVKGGRIWAVVALALGVGAAAFRGPGVWTDGKTAAARATDAAKLLSLLDSGEPSPGGEICALAVSPDGTLLATGTRDGSVGLWDASRQRQLARWTAHQGTVTALAFFLDSRALLSSGAERTVAHWFLEDEAFLPAGRWEAAGHVTALAVAPDGRTVAVATGDRLEFRDAVRGNLLPGGALSVPNVPLRALAFSPDGGSLAGGGGGDNAVRVWELAAGRPVSRLTLAGCTENWVRGLAYTSDGRTLVSLDTEGRVFAWDRSGKLVGESRAGQPPCLHAALGAGGRLALTATGREGPARFLRLPEGWWR